MTIITRTGRSRAAPPHRLLTVIEPAYDIAHLDLARNMAVTMVFHLMAITNVLVRAERRWLRLLDLGS
jgi:hypothetical protein